MSCWVNDPAFVTELGKGRTFEEDLVKHTLKDYIMRSTYIVDVGAHVGMHTVAYAFMNPRATIYAFEPQKMLYEILKHNVNANGYQDRVYLHNNAVGHVRGDAEMGTCAVDAGACGHPVEYGTQNYVNLGGLALGRGGEKVNMICLDDLQLPGCDFMKIDVEGAEPLVIAGALKIIQKYRPVVMYERNDKTITEDMKQYFGLSDETPDVQTILTNLNYTIQELPHENFLAIPIPISTSMPTAYNYRLNRLHDQ
jgi:FkbM family methyltransferase